MRLSLEGKKIPAHMTRAIVYIHHAFSILHPCHAALPGSLSRQPCPAAFPGSLSRQPCTAALPGSLARHSCPVALPASLAQQPCPAALPGSLARQHCPAALPGSLAEKFASYFTAVGRCMQHCILLLGRQFSSSFPRN
jgi:hypothetical protein